MLEITIPSRDFYDEDTETFFTVHGQTLRLEHSLISLSKWESKWNKVFMSKEPKSQEETIDYIKCMTLTQNVDPNLYKCLTNENIQQINQYIEAPMTATTFGPDKTAKHSREVVTSELVYYWMIALNIPFECQKWHLNRLLTFIRVCNIKNQPPKKMSKRELMSRNSQLNAARRKQLNTTG